MSENNIESLSAPKHDEVESFKGSPSSDNPAEDPFNVVISVPEIIHVKMVDASALSDYEVWIFIASVISNAAVGFSVALYQAIDSKSSTVSYACWTAAMFWLLFAISAGTAFRKRSSMQKKGKDIKLKTTSASTK